MCTHTHHLHHPHVHTYTSPPPPTCAHIHLTSTTHMCTHTPHLHHPHVHTHTPHLNTIQGPVSCDLELLQQYLMFNIIDAHKLGSSSSKNSSAIRSIAETGEMTNKEETWISIPPSLHTHTTPSLHAHHPLTAHTPPTHCIHTPPPHCTHHPLTAHTTHSLHTHHPLIAHTHHPLTACTHHCHMKTLRCSLSQSLCCDLVPNSTPQLQIMFSFNGSSLKDS